MAPYRLLALSRAEVEFMIDIMKTKEPGEFASGEHDNAFKSLAKKLGYTP